MIQGMFDEMVIMEYPSMEEAKNVNYAQLQIWWGQLRTADYDSKAEQEIQDVWQRRYLEHVGRRDSTGTY